ncbi:MAG: dihydrolipoyl dehydrogenase family protein, partial [Eubacteriaceae bacterium]
YPYDGKKVLSSDEVLELETPPESMIIVGGGIIGCEIGQLLNRMGTKVTMVEKADQILPLEDAEAVKLLVRQFKKDKIKIITNQSIEKIEVTETGVLGTLENGEHLEASMMLVTIGRRSAIDNLNLDNLGVVVDGFGRIVVNEKMETNIKTVFAIGDIVPTPLLAHVASKEGIVAACNAVNNAQKKVNYQAVPRCIYTEPEIASVGMSERECDANNVKYKVGRFDFRASGKAQAIGKTQGFVKVIVDDKDVVIGGVIVGAHATELLPEISLAVHARLTAETLGEVIHAHPTLSEAIMEAAHDVHGVSINKG